MEAKSFNEAARALVLWGALQVDLSRKAQSEEERQAADDLLGLLTPVIKGYLTDKGFEAAVNSQQIFGGHGYIREHGMEQFVRDARIAQIYEGTNGIQALDLVGRKLGKDGGRAIQAFFKLVGEEAAAAKNPPRDGEGDRSPQANGGGGPDANAAVAYVATALERAIGDLQTATLWLMNNGLSNPNNAGAAAYPYMTLMGIVTLGLMWLRMAKTSAALLTDGTDNAEFHRSKLLTARFFADRIMPQSNAERRKIEAGAESIMALPAEAF
jgi:hypothetical protein